MRMENMVQPAKPPPFGPLRARADRGHVSIETDQHITDLYLSAR
jgi:hypothetical protein